jgi:HIRAN domain-containing protein
MAPLKAVLAALGFAAAIHAPPIPAAEAVIIVQRSPLAGFRHYDGPEFWSDIRTGDRLELVREPENPYDAGAIRVEWRGRKLGYVPQRDNAAIARQMDRGTPLEARVAALRQNRNRSLRIEFEVTAPLQ